jgi:hypothetical protein
VLPNGCGCALPDTRARLDADIRVHESTPPGSAQLSLASPRSVWRSAIQYAAWRARG